MAEIGFNQAGLAQYAGPGHWNDPDMLEVGNGGMTETEYRTHMSLWALLAAPLLAGNDLSKMTPATLAMLTDKDVIAIDQDKLGQQGTRIWQEGLQEVWSKPLSGGAVAVGLFNRSPDGRQVKLSLASVKMSSGASLHDIWANKDVKPTGGAYTSFVPGHGVVLLRISK